MILGHIGAAAEPAVPALTAALRDPNRGLRLTAADALGRIGGSGREVLQGAARDADPGVREAAVAGLGGGLRDTGTRHDTLASALGDPDPAVRTQAIGQLHAGTRDEAQAMADLLVRGFDDASPSVREAARRQFIGLYQHQLVTPRFLVKILASADAESRADAAWQLGNGFASPIPVMRDTPTAQTLEALRVAVRDPEPKVRIYAARALVAADPGARDVVAQTLRDAMARVDAELQVRAARVLWQTTHAPKDVLGAYETGLGASNKYVRFEAMDAIREMGPAAEPLRPALERLNDDPDREVRRRAEVTLAAVARR